MVRHCECYIINKNMHNNTRKLLENKYKVLGVIIIQHYDHVYHYIDINTFNIRRC